MTTRKWLGSSANWTTAADWSGGVTPGTSDDVVINQGAPQVTAGISVHSITDNSQLSFSAAGASTIAADLTVGGAFSFDGNAGAGGSSLAVSGTFTIGQNGTATLGNATSSAFTFVRTGSLALVGSLTLAAGASKQTDLDVQSAAGFGVAGVLRGQIALSGVSFIRFLGGGEITRIATNASLQLNGAQAVIANSVTTGANTALTSLGSVGVNATLGLSNGARIADTAALWNYGNLRIDFNVGDGGSTFTDTGEIYNAGFLDIGNTGLSATSFVQAASLRNTGVVGLTGVAGKEAILELTTGAASLGLLTGTYVLGGYSLFEVASGQYTGIAAGATVELDSANGFIADAGATGTNSALTGLKVNNGHFDLFGGAAASVSGAFANYDLINLGGTATGYGGGSLAVNGILTNAGEIDLSDYVVGDALLTASALSNSGTLDVGDVIENSGTYANIRIAGGAGFGQAGTVTGTVQLNLGGFITFGAGAITDVKRGADLDLEGGGLNLAGNSTTNAALAKLRQVEGEFDVGRSSNFGVSAALSNSGEVHVRDGGKLTVNSTYTNSGETVIGDDGYNYGGTLIVDALRNTGSLKIIGDENPNFAGELQAVAVAGAAGTGAAGVLTGDVELDGYAVLQFNSGDITSIEGTLSLSTDYAFVDLAGAFNGNDALNQLRTVKGKFALANGATVDDYGSLQVAGGEIDLVSGSIGAALNVNVEVDNEGTIHIGDDQSTVVSTLDAGSLVNNGVLRLDGAATMLIYSIAGFGSIGALSGEVTLTGGSVIDFNSGSITTIRSGASLTIDGRNAFLANASNTNANSALTGLTEIAGILEMDDGALLLPSGSLTVSRLGELDLDISGGGGSIISGGTLDNEGAINLGNAAMTSANDLAVSRLTNNGSIYLTGSATAEAEMYIGSAAGFGTAGVLSGDVELAGDAVMLFASGGISRIDNYADLDLTGAGALVADVGSTSSNSALTKLAQVNGTLRIADHVTIVSAAASVTITGYLGIDEEVGGSQFTAKALVNYGTLVVGSDGMTQSSTLSTSSFTNEGYAVMIGAGGAHATLNVSGAVTNYGQLNIFSDAQTFTGAVSGDGEMTLSSGTTLEFDAAVAAAQTIVYDSFGADKLVLKNAATFAASIQSFAVDDAIDLLGFSATSTLAYAGDATSGVLTVTSGAHVAHLNFLDSLTLASFAHVSDGAGGLLLSHS